MDIDFFRQTEGFWPSLSILILFLAIISTTLIIWRRYFSRRILMRRVEELEALSAAGRAIVASELDVNALAELIANESKKIIETGTFQVGLFNEEVYRILYWTIDGARQETPESFDISGGEGLINWIRKTQKPMLIRDFEREMTTLPARPRYISQSPPRSGLFIPLISGEEAIGVVAAQSHEPNCFQEEDMRRLMILANQSAAAIANARLYEQERMRAAHLELVGQIARQVNAVQDREEIFDQVVSLTKSTFGFHPVSIFDIDPRTGEAVIQASSDRDVLPNSARIGPEQGIVGAAAANRETIVSNNTADDPRYVRALESTHFLVAHDSASEIAIPLIVDNRVLGVLDVQSETLGAFNESEKTVLEALAAEVGTAIHKAQQFAWQQREAWISTAQLQVAEAISRSDDLEEVIEAVSRLTPMLTGVSFCGILLWDEELQYYRGVSLHSADGSAAEDFAAISLPIGQWHALDAVHVGGQMLNTQQVPEWLRRILRQLNHPLQGIYILPLITSGSAQPHGVMLVDEYADSPIIDDRNLPGQRRLDLLNNIAQQTSIAVESERLRTAQQEEAWVNTALLQVAEAVNSLIDLNEILDTIVRLIPMLVGVESVIILMRDDENKHFVPGPSYGVGTMGLGLLETLVINDEEYQAMIAVIDSPQLPSDTVHFVRSTDWLKTVLGAPYAMAISLNAQGRLVGSMLVGISLEDKRRLSNRRLNILNGIAQQAATAVVNNQLYRESAERLRLQQELDVAREIQESFLPSGSPQIPGLTVASFWRAARQVSGDFYDFIQREDGSWGILIADVADKGVPAALFMALSRTILRTVGINRSDPAEVLMRVNEIINFDAESDLFVTVFFAHWDPKKGLLSYANGGHNPPLLLKANGEHDWLRAPGIALGILPEIHIPRNSIQLLPGDTLILYTDGVTEAVNADLDEFGTERLYWTARSSHTAAPQEIINAITSSVNEHTGDTPQFDDVAMVVLQRNV
jgi:serine phosphatase RsbU (regulator of sigma subunit)/putative methionine-R-sulfoxide reductase with GAF domain